MNRFELTVYETVRLALHEIDSAVVPDIYALSFFLSDDEARAPMLEFGYNTQAQANASMLAGASDAGEAKWNFAFWLQNELAFVGLPDSEEQRVLSDLLKEEGLWFSDDEEETDFERCLAIGDKIGARFADMCVAAARQLHASGVIAARFGRAIPIIVHELEYYERIAVLTEAANPPGLAAEFTGWVRSL